VTGGEVTVTVLVVPVPLGAVTVVALVLDILPDSSFPLFFFLCHF
jgi:hypothetical protein